MVYTDKAIAMRSFDEHNLANHICILERELMRRNSIITIIYIAIGIIMASNRGYLTSLGVLGNLLSALIAIALWPLLLVGVNLHLAI